MDRVPACLQSMNRVPAWFWFCLAMTSSSLAQTPIRAKLGQNVTLLCKAPNNKATTGVQWNRPDQKDDYVFLYRGGKLITEHQHESYQNRVHLQDQNMKDGNVALVLKNVMKEDKGRYECLPIQKTKIEPIIIDLDILPSEHQDGNTGDGGNSKIIILGRIVIGVSILVVLATVGFLMYRRKLKVFEELKGISKVLVRQNSNSPPPSPVTPDDHQLNN